MYSILLLLTSLLPHLISALPQGPPNPSHPPPKVPCGFTDAGAFIPTAYCISTPSRVPIPPTTPTISPHFTHPTITSLPLPSTTATPSPSPSSSSAAAAAAPPIDACGPKVHAPTDPPDTCTTTPALASSAFPFGILGLTNKIPTNYDWTICDPVISQICQSISSATTPLGTWVLKTSSVALDYGTLGCQMGIYLPADPGAAAKPAEKQCENVFRAIRNAAFNAISWNGATVNLKTNPGSVPGQYALPDGAGTGAAVNAGYPSYFIYTKQDLNPNTAPDGEVLPGGNTRSDGGVGNGLGGL